MFLRSASAWTVLAILTLGGIASAEGPSQSFENMLLELVQTDQQKCLRLNEGHARLPSTRPKAQSECESALPENNGPVKFSYAEQKSNAGPVSHPGDLPEYGNSESNPLLRSFATFPLLDEQLTAELDFGYSYIAREGQPEPEGEGMGARLGLKGEWDHVKYWAEYSFFGNEFTNSWDATPQDYLGGTFGAELDLGILTSRVEIAQFHNDVAGDPTESRTITSEGKVSLDLSVPQWPIVSLTYAHNQEKETSRQTGTVEGKFSTDTLSGTLSYARSTWDAYVTSSYSSTQDQLDPDYVTDVVDYMLGGSYRPIDGLSIIPFVEFTQSFDRWSEVRWDTLYASVGLDYSIEKSMTFSLSGSFMAEQASDGYYDTRQFDTSIGVVKNLGNAFGLPHDKATLSFMLNYSRGLDLVYQDANWEAYSVLVFFEIAP